jgi:trimeric autotransporter adhesin
VASTSPAKNLKLTNNRSTALTITGIALGGTNPGDFLKTTTCGASLAAFASCTISVRFKPTALGARSATVKVNNNASLQASLTGTGAAQVTVAPTSLSFGSVTHGTTSAAKLVSVTNNQSAALTISAISLSGTNPGDFLKTTTCGASLAAFASCTVSVKFKPATTGARSATLTVTDSPDTGSPHKVSLGGTGL